ncbi:hypothetical protein Pmani_016366 [Petrolisthes manimaculis]|uniref:Uncharacterized protein n=1 Tax=Petrolisthes manimaculis TaxID=1843537 RepID=A0AAE1U6R1_9EUCA|nr:hypothetical protein Pmani_016366 [Petrolisthes manimaculis]
MQRFGVMLVQKVKERSSRRASQKQVQARSRGRRRTKCVRFEGRKPSQVDGIILASVVVAGGRTLSAAGAVFTVAKISFFVVL